MSTQNDSEMIDGQTLERWAIESENDPRTAQEIMEQCPTIPNPDFTEAIRAWEEENQIKIFPTHQETS